MSDSPWKESARKHKKFVQGGLETKPVGNKRKNRKKWCKGKVGVEHQPVCMDFHKVKNDYTQHQPFKDKCYSTSDHWRVLVCAVCGKELDWYYPMEFNVQARDGTTICEKPDPPPPWVTF